MTILNIPNEDYLYEFMVVKFLTNDENGEAIYDFRKNFENGFLADEYASTISGTVVHRVRIQGKVRRLNK